MRSLLPTHAPAAVIVIRLMVGAVFVSEGVQKFVFPAEVGAGRFANIGIPAPEIAAPMVACFEIACGTLVLVGGFTRLAAIPLLAIIVTAMITTKIPLLRESGFWKMAHEARTDWSMLLGLIFLLLVGAGRWSIDAWFGSKRQSVDRSRGVSDIP